MKHLWILFSLALALCLGAGCGDDPVENANGSAGPLGVCSSANPCPDGQFCFNGICALGCTNDGNCADNQYCDTEWSMTCQNKEVTTCPETPCASSQICQNGLCSTPPPPTMCMPRADGLDGCEENAICIGEEDGMGGQDNSCYTFPPCSQDGTCPVGTSGAVCNTDLIPNKGRICLTGLCKDASHCPSNWHCVRFNPNDPVGFCGNGGPGAPCSEPAHCNDMMCQTIPGSGGFCGFGFGGF